MLNAFYQQGNSEQVCEMLRILITLGKRVAAVAAVAAKDGHLLWLTYRSLCFTPGPARGPLSPAGPAAVGASDTAGARVQPRVDYDEGDVVAGGGGVSADGWQQMCVFGCVEETLGQMPGEKKSDSIGHGPG